MAVLDGPDAPDAGDGHSARVTPGPPGRAGPHRPPDGHEVSVAPGADGLSGAHHRQAYSRTWQGCSGIGMPNWCAWRRS